MKTIFCLFIYFENALWNFEDFRFKKSEFQRFYYNKNDNKHNRLPHFWE